MSWLGQVRIDLAACGSTNDEAARLARAGARHGTIVIADAQDAGRGRDGRAWASPRGLGLYLSAVVRPPLPLALVPPMTLAIGIAVCDAARAFGAAAALKWPNDTLVGDRKLAGVLVEAQSQGNRLEAVIVGIGVNLGGELPVEVATTAITLEQAVAGAPVPAPGAPLEAPLARTAPISRAAVLDRLLVNIEYWIDRYVASGLPAVIPAWHARMAPGLDARAMLDGEPVEGEVAGLDSDGALVLRDDAGRLHRIRAGQVETVRRTARKPVAAEPPAAPC